MTKTDFNKEQIPNKDSTQTDFIAGEDLTAGDALCQIKEEIDNNTIIDNTGTGATQLGYNVGSTELSQSIEVGPYNIKNVKVNLYKSGNPIGNITCKIYSDEGITLLATSQNTIAENSLTTSTTEYTFNFNEEYLGSGIKYVTFEVDRANSTSNFSVISNNNTNPYAGGQTYTVSSTGVYTGISVVDLRMNVTGDIISKTIKTDASNINKINFIGFANDTVTTGNTVKVNTSGVDNNQSGLTVGSDYYLNFPIGNISDSIDQTSNNVEQEFGNSAANVGIGQTITTSNLGLGIYRINSIDLKVWANGSPTDNLVMKIYDDTSKSTLLQTSNNVDMTGLPTTSPGVNKIFTFSSPIDLVKNTQYYIEVTRDGGVDASNFPRIRLQNTDVYTGGNWYRNISGTPTSQAGDLYFLLDLEYQDRDTNVLGKIDTVPGANVRRIGKSVSATVIELETSANDSLDGTTSTTATTGSVVLGNAEGYITIKINGEDKKLPYYGL